MSSSFFCAEHQQMLMDSDSLLSPSGSSWSAVSSLREPPGVKVAALQHPDIVNSVKDQDWSFIYCSSSFHDGANEEQETVFVRLLSGRRGDAVFQEGYKNTCYITLTLTGLQKWLNS